MLYIFYCIDQCHCRRAVSQSDSSDHVGGFAPDENLWQFIQFVISCWLWLKSSRLEEEQSCMIDDLDASQLLAHKKSWHNNHRRGNTTTQYYEAEPFVHTTTPYEVLQLLRQHEYTK